MGSSAAMRLSLPTVSRAFVLLCALASLAAQTPVVTAIGDTMRLRSSTVTAGTAGAFNVTLVVENDNANASLPVTFRRWWHCQLGNLNPAGTTMTITVDSTSGYTDVILPVWAQSTDGVTFGSYQRCPLSAIPVVLSAGRHRFTLTTPPGVTAIRLAKYFPYTVARKDAWLAALAGDPHVRSITAIGSSQQGRPIQRIELTDGAVPDAGKVRIWIHSAVHPSESTSYFTLEGLVAWLTSGNPYAELLLDHALIDIVPMANPDGVFLGNYRTNANSVDLEAEWAAPYNSTQPEIVALRTAIAGYMGTVGAPGSNPIELLLNLHSSHNIDYPFHFQHNANAAWTAGATGVLPIVNQREGQWISLFQARSPFANLGTTQASSAGFPQRPFVESMMHDRWTAVNGWMNAPNNLQPVMAITFEGTYGLGPDQLTWNTEADYRQCGADMGLSMCDYFGLVPTASVQSFGSSCLGATLVGQLSPASGLNQTLTVTVGGAPANAFCVLVVGAQQLPAPVALPSPWSNCSALISLDTSFTFLANGLGIGQLAAVVPPLPGLVAHLQCGVANPLVPPFGSIDTTNGVTLRNQY